MGSKAIGRKVHEDCVTALREPAGAYSSDFAIENEQLRGKNGLFWKIFHE
jgi:hypothetical protein